MTLTWAMPGDDINEILSIFISSKWNAQASKHLIKCIQKAALGNNQRMTIVYEYHITVTRESIAIQNT